MQSQNNTIDKNVNNSTIVIGNRLPPFSWLPNYLVNDPSVSAEALAAALYLHGKAPGWVTHPNDVRKRFGWGKHTWLKVSKELKELGLLHETKHANGTTLTFDIMASFSESDPRVDFRKVRKSDVAKIDTLNKKDFINKKDPFIKDHIDDVKKAENRTIKQREQALDFEQGILYGKLIGFKGMLKRVALSIVEDHTIAAVNNVLEMATKDTVPNPGGYVVRSLYKLAGN